MDRDAGELCAKSKISAQLHIFGKTKKLVWSKSIKEFVQLNWQNLEQWRWWSWASERSDIWKQSWVRTRSSPSRYAEAGVVEALASEQPSRYAEAGVVEALASEQPSRYAEAGVVGLQPCPCPRTVTNWQGRLPDLCVQARLWNIVQTEQDEVLSAPTTMHGKKTVISFVVF